MFVPTHEIKITRHGSTDIIHVMVVDGAAYTHEEHDADVSADWEVDDDGVFSCRGEVPVCDEYTVTAYVDVIKALARADAAINGAPGDADDHHNAIKTWHRECLAAGDSVIELTKTALSAATIVAAIESVGDLASVVYGEERVAAHKADEGRREYLALCARVGITAVTYEHDTLSVGREFLPPCAVEVLDGADGTAEYWAWLTEQIAGARE